MKESNAPTEGTGLKIAIIVTRWNEFVTKQLLEGALDELESQDVAASLVIWVPGAWEIPIAAQRVAQSTNAPDAIVALGCILQGETPHAGLLASQVSSSLMNLQLATGIPISWGVLTPDTADQAIDRAGMKHGNKGREAAQAALAMARLLDSL